MERVRDFSPYELKVSVYDGAAEKRTMLMDGHLYMVKFGYDAAPQEEHPSRTSYVNLPVNEYIGSKVFAASGIPTQDVILGDYKGRSVVACRDFMYEMDPNLMLLHFKQLEISMPGGSSRSKARPDWEFVSQVLDEHDALEGIRARARHRFLQMTCVDALIGNFDRHANNWGFIADRRTADILDLAPVYDCGSSLSPSLSREGMRERVEDPQQMREANMAAPYMAMNVGGKRRKFAFFLTSETARPFRAELPELWPRLSEKVTDRIVEQTPGLDDLQRDFYKATLAARRKYVLGPAYRMALKEAETSTATVGNDTLATDIVPGIPFPGLGGNPGLLH